MAWQKRHRYPLRIACEATLNIAKNEKTLELMRDAGFVTIFCGIETPEPAALQAMSKSQNLRLPILDAVETINKYGMEVVSGIIIGLDTDTPDSADRIIEFIRASQIPILTINVLYALPKTPLWDRLERAGRIRERGGARVQRGLPPALRAPCSACGGSASRPPTSPAPSTGATRISSGTPSGTGPGIRWTCAASRPHNVRRGLGIFARLFWRLGVRSSYRGDFWRMAARTLGRGRFEEFVQSAVVSHHLIEFARQCLAGMPEPSFYAPSRTLAPVPAAEA